MQYFVLCWVCTVVNNHYGHFLIHLMPCALGLPQLFMIFFLKDFTFSLGGIIVPSRGLFHKLRQPSNCTSGALQSNLSAWLLRTKRCRWEQITGFERAWSYCYMNLILVMVSKTHFTKTENCYIQGEDAGGIYFSTHTVEACAQLCLNDICCKSFDAGQPGMWRAFRACQ